MCASQQITETCRHCFNTTLVELYRTIRLFTKWMDAGILFGWHTYMYTEESMMNTGTHIIPPPEYKVPSDGKNRWTSSWQRNFHTDRHRDGMYPHFPI